MRLRIFTNQVYFLSVICEFLTLLNRIKELIDFATTFVYIMWLSSA